MSQQPEAPSLIPPSPYVEWFVDRTKGQDVSRQMVLDVGSGFGRNSLYIAANLDYDSVVGIDTNQEDLQEAEQKARMLGATSCQFIRQDMASIPRLGKFDVVLANEVFQNGPKLRTKAMLEAIRRATKSNGVNIISGYMVTPEVKDPTNRSQMFYSNELTDIYYAEGWKIELSYEVTKPVIMHGGKEIVNSLTGIIARKPAYPADDVF